jgi:hypothetical protein
MGQRGPVTATPRGVTWGVVLRSDPSRNQALNVTHTRKCSVIGCSKNTGATCAVSPVAWAPAVGYEIHPTHWGMGHKRRPPPVASTVAVSNDTFPKEGRT